MEYIYIYTYVYIYIYIWHVPLRISTHRFVGIEGETNLKPVWIYKQDSDRDDEFKS